MPFTHVSNYECCTAFVRHFRGYRFETKHMSRKFKSAIATEMETQMRTLKFNINLTNPSCTYLHSLLVFQKIVIFTARKRSLGQGNIFTPVCHSVHRGGGGVVSQHAPGSHYIRSYTGAATQLVWRQHTGNIKCMMG